MNIETIRQALSALRANWLRSLLTLMIIAFGIMAVVGILTAIDAAIYSINDNFSVLGTSSLSIKSLNQNRRSRRGGSVEKRAEPINFDEAMSFKEGFGESGIVSLEMQVTGNGVAKHGKFETNPNVDVVGVDESYFQIKSFDIEEGRAITSLEARQGAKVAVIGAEIVKNLFDGRPERALGKSINMGSLRLEVVGTMARSGSSMSDGANKMVAMPVQAARQSYGTQKTPFQIYVKIPDVIKLEGAVSTATGAMRIARGLGPRDKNDFEIVTSESLVEEIREDTSKLQAGAIAIGLMTLFGAAIGLMNIMLVSVTERTREIGIVKALGASRTSILAQFLTEAVVITQLGGVIGILIGMMVGNIVTLIAGGEFLIPWDWIVLSFIVCLITGLISGLYPAIKASRLDPIESLRYE